MVDRLVDEIVQALREAVAQLDPRQIPERDAAQLVRRDRQLCHVPGVDRDSAVGRRGALDDRESGIDAP